MTPAGSRRGDAETRVRAARAGDASRYSYLVDEHPMFSSYGWTREGLESSIGDALRKGHAIGVCEVCGSAAGLVWGIEEGAFARSGYVRLVIVARAFEGRGVASLLMDWVEHQLYSAAPDVFLLVNENNLRAQRFYERRGYVRIGEVSEYVVPDEAEAIYRKKRT